MDQISPKRTLYDNMNQLNEKQNPNQLNPVIYPE